MSKLFSSMLDGQKEDSNSVTALRRSNWLLLRLTTEPGDKKSSSGYPANICDSADVCVFIGVHPQNLRQNDIVFRATLQLNLSTFTVPVRTCERMTNTVCPFLSHMHVSILWSSCKIPVRAYFSPHCWNWKLPFQAQLTFLFGID